MARSKLTAVSLHSLLISELRRRRVWSCACRMPLPFAVERPDEHAPNWRVGSPKRCSNGCDSLIAEIVTEAWHKYELAAPPLEPESLLRRAIAAREEN